MNLEELKDSLTDEDVMKILQRLGATNAQDNGNYLTFPTVCHNEHEGDAGKNLIYYKDSKLFHCFSECSETFDIYQLVKKRFENFEPDQDTHLASLFYFVYNYIDIDSRGIRLQPQTYKKMATKYEAKDIEHLLPEYNASAVEAFLTYYPVEWLNDHISKESMDKYNIRFDHQKTAVVIPHYDVHNRLIGMRQRNLNKESAEKYGKYRPMYIEGIVYSHPLAFNLYGFNVVKDNIKKYKTVIVAEGEKAALQAHTLFGEDNVVVSTCGSSFNRWQLMLLLQYGNVNEVIIAFDREEKKGESVYFNKLWEMCKKYSSYTNMSFIYDNNTLGMKENIFDLGDKDECLELIRKRVRVK